MTGREHLRMFARLRGIPEREVRRHPVNLFQRDVGRKCADRRRNRSPVAQARYRRARQQSRQRVQVRWHHRPTAALLSPRCSSFACFTYSGGTKRKLSLAIALISSPPVIMLVRAPHPVTRPFVPFPMLRRLQDEPSTGLVRCTSSFGCAATDGGKIN